MNPSTVTSDSLRPDLLLAIRKKCLHILELTVGLKVKFVNLFLSTLGVFGRTSGSFDDMPRDLKIAGQQSKIIEKIYIAISKTQLL